MKLISILLLSFALGGCATQYPNQNPINQIFPTVSGQSLEKVSMTLPGELPQEPVILILGYVQNSQFDIDRWLIGLDMTETTTKAYELPTIQGMFPRMFKTQIDNGMRRGIPKELWGGVITIYDDGEQLQQLTGNDNPNNARVILLDEQRQIVYFYDRGFSVAALNTLREKIAALED